MTPLVRFVSPVFFLLACFALPWQAAAQTPPIVEISFEEDLEQEEGTVFRFTVNLSAALLEARTFNIAYRTFDPSRGIDDPATLATDLGTRPTTLMIPTGVTEVTFDVQTVDDNIAESPEVFSVSLSVPTPFPANPRNTLVLDARANNRILDNDSAAIRIFSQRQIEHQDFRFRITTDGARLERAVPMTWTVTDGTASVANDLKLSSTSGSITLPASVGDAFAQAFLEIPINNDALVESDETFTVTLSARGAQPPGVVYNSGARATGTITDSLTVFSLSPGARNSLVEGRQYYYTINLNKPLSQPVYIVWTATDGTATVADDLQDPITSRVFFPAGSTTGTSFIIRSRDDTEAEPDETFTVTISEDPAAPLPSTAIVSLDNNSTVATILDNDELSATISIADESVAENVAGGTVTFTAALDQAVPGDVVLDVAVTAGTATLADDFGTPLPPTVTIAEGNLTGTFTVPITDDAIVEGNETFTVTLREDNDNPLPDGVTISNENGTATGTITEDDTAEVTLRPSTAVEAEDGTFTYTVSLSAAADEAVTVRWTATDGTATVADDLQETTNTVTFAANDNTAQEFTISSVNDTDDEEDETFTVTLSADTEGGNPLPTGVTIGTGNSSAATIKDNDETPGDDAMVRIGDRTVDEAAGNASFTVTLSRAVTSPVVLAVTYADGSATVADDLGTFLPPTVTIAADTTEATIAVPIIDDDLVEGEETFTVTVSEPLDTPLPEGVSIADGEATGTITDNDEAPPGDDALVRIGDVTVGEAEGTATFTVTLSEAVSSPVVLAVTYADGSAEVATDLGSPLSATVTVAADTTEATLAVPIVDDDLIEGAETFTVSLGEDPANPLPDGVTLADGEATGTITDNDGAPPPREDATVSLSPLALSRTEGGTFNFQVALSQASASPVTVRWTATASGVRPATLTGPSSDLKTGQVTTATVTFPANSVASREFTIITRNDALVEGTETFTVTLAEDPANPLPPRVRIGFYDAEATATIFDDTDDTEDEMAMVSIAPAEARQPEGNPFNFAVNLSGAVNEAVTVTWTAEASGDTAATLTGPDSDLGPGQAITGTVFFAAGADGEQTFSIATLDDTRVEDAETFTVTLSGRLPMRVDFDTRTATATITDDDLATVDIEDAPPVAEGAGPARFRVTLNGELDRDVVLDVAYAAGSAELTDLGSPRPTTVTIAAGGTEASLDVPIFDDELVEGEETFTVILTGDSLPNGVSVADGMALGTIAQTPELPEQSALIESRRSGAGAALRRHVNRFDLMTGTQVRNRLDDRETRNLGGAKSLGDDNPLAVGGGLSRELGGTHWGTWIDGAWAGLSGTASGQQADLYGGVDYRSDNGRWLIGALAGYELADLDAGEANYQADFTQFGFYGGARLSERLLFDVATTYGMATPEIALGDVSASYDARRFTARAALTGNFGLEYGMENGSVKIEPQLGALYSRVALGAFTDSVGGVAGREVLELGRFNAGPRLTWEFEGGEVVGGVRLQSDVLELEDGVDGRISGAADIGLRLELRPDFSVGFQLDLDGIGIEEDFGSFGGRIEFGIGFGSGPRTTQVQKRGTNEATSSGPRVPTTSDR